MFASNPEPYVCVSHKETRFHQNGFSFVRTNRLNCGKFNTIPVEMQKTDFTDVISVGDEVNKKPQIGSSNS